MRSPLKLALMVGPENLPPVVDFFISGATDLATLSPGASLEWSGGYPTPTDYAHEDPGEAVARLPDVLSKALDAACVYMRPTELEVLLKVPGVDPTAADSAVRFRGATFRVLRSHRRPSSPPLPPLFPQSLRWCAWEGQSVLLSMLLADGRADPAVCDQFCIQAASMRGHTAVVNALLADPRVDPTAHNGRALALARKFERAESVAALCRDPRWGGGGGAGEAVVDDGALPSLRTAAGFGW